MRREIEEAPSAVERALADRASIAAVARVVEGAGPPWISIVARGTSDHAAVYARYLIETHLGVPVSLAAPSVTTIYEAPLQWRDGVLIAISQSGRSDDLVAVVERARAAGATTVSITNAPRSPLAVAAEWQLACHAGREQAVPATKTYLAELAVVAALVAALRPSSALAAALPTLGDALGAAFQRGRDWLADGALVDALAAGDRALVVSRGYNLATALELALKLKETTGVFAEAYSATDFAHGPAALSAPDVPLVVIRPDGPMGASIAGHELPLEVRARLTVTIGGAEVTDGPCSLSVGAGLPEALTPLAYAIPGLLLVEALARARGRDPDAPGGLTKITRTR